MSQHARSRHRLLIGGVLGSVLVWSPGVRADEPAVAEIPEAVLARARTARELVEFLDHHGFYSLRDPKEKEAIQKLREVPEEAAPLLAKQLARGLSDPERRWIEVYRPLYLLKALGPHAQVAQPDIVRALGHPHPINVGAAAEVLEAIGPPAKDAFPALIKAREKSAGGTQFQQNALRRAIKAVDPEGAKRAGVL